MPFALREQKGDSSCVLSYSDTIIWIPRAAHATVERWLTPGTSRVISSLHAISRAFASVRLFAPEANADADSSAHWNPLYAMMGRPQASSPAENVDCSRGVVDKGR